MGFNCGSQKQEAESTNLPGGKAPVERPTQASGPREELGPQQPLVWLSR